MTEHNTDEENFDPDNEPVPIGDVVDNPEEVMAFDGDPEREHSIAVIDLRHEIVGLELQALELMAAQEEGQDIPDFDDQLSRLNQSLMSAQAELSDLRFKRPSN